MSADAELGGVSSLSGHPEGAAISKEELIELCQPALTHTDVLKRLSTDAVNGLTTEEAEKRLLVYGNNELMKQSKMPLWLLFISQFANLIIMILLTAAVVSIIVGELVEGIAVIIIVL